MSKRTEQRLMGIGLLLICAFVLWMCSTGVTPEDRDATAVVLLAPSGAVDAVHKRDCDILKIGRLSEDSLPVLLSVVVSMAWILFVNIVSRPNKLI